MQTTQADIIIAGGGLAGLTLAVECAGHPFFEDKKIIILDRDDKTVNDRTWCFWATDAEQLPPVTHHIWNNCRFLSSNLDKMLQIAPFRYHMVRGIDFYRWAKAEISKNSRIEWVNAAIESIDAAQGLVRTSAGQFQGRWVFNSALREKIDLPHPDTRFTQLLQHFKGWVIRTPEPRFDPAVMTFMDYRIAQKGDTRFVYVLPLSAHTALVEYTVFSPALCPEEEYDRELQLYIRNLLHITDFEIEETEFGVIPMTDVPLKNREGRVVHIGTAGGFVKGSSGYAFKRTQRKIRQLVQDWIQKGEPNPELLQSGWRFRFYDSVMLRVLKGQSVPGSRFFTQLFRKLPARLVFRFLDEDSTFAEDIRLLSAPPTWPFLKTAIQQIPVLRKI